MRTPEGTGDEEGEDSRRDSSDRDHDAFALWVLSSSERAVFNSSLRMLQKARALLHSGDGRDRTPTCDLWHVRLVVLVMPTKVEETMAYQAEISRKNPGCFLFLVDQSESMEDPFGGGEAG